MFDLLFLLPNWQQLNWALNKEFTWSFSLGRDMHHGAFVRPFNLLVGLLKKPFTCSSISSFLSILKFIFFHRYFFNHQLSNLSFSRIVNIDNQITFVVRCAVQYHMHNLKNVKNTHGGVLLLVNFNKSNTPPWVFFTFFKLYKWYQMVQSATFVGITF